MQKRKTKFKSVFQSDAKTKNENWNSYPFFKVKRKRKKKYEVQIRFSKLSENEKQKAKFKSVFQCHAKTKNVNGIWILFSHAIEKRLTLRYMHSYRLLTPQVHLGTYSTHEVWSRHRFVVVAHTQLVRLCFSRELCVYFKVTVRGESRIEYLWNWPCYATNQICLGYVWFYTHDYAQFGHQESFNWTFSNC